MLASYFSYANTSPAHAKTEMTSTEVKNIDLEASFIREPIVLQMMENPI